MLKQIHESKGRLAHGVFETEIKAAAGCPEETDSGWATFERQSWDELMRVTGQKKKKNVDIKSKMNCVERPAPGRLLFGLLGSGGPENQTTDPEQGQHRCY